MKKEEKEREELGWGLHFWKGAMKEKKKKKGFVHWEVPLWAGMTGKAGGGCGGGRGRGGWDLEPQRRAQQQVCSGQIGESNAQKDQAYEHSPG